MPNKSKGEKFDIDDDVEAFNYSCPSIKWFTGSKASKILIG